MNCTGKSVCSRQLYRYFVNGLQGNNCINESAYFTEISHLIPLAQHGLMFGHADRDRLAHLYQFTVRKHKTKKFVYISYGKSVS